MNARDRILSNIRQAVAKAPLQSTPSGHHALSPPPAPEPESLVQVFRKEAEAQDVSVCEAKDPNEAAQLLGSILQRLGARAVFTDRDPFLEHPAVQAVLAEQGVRDVTPPPADPEHVFDREAFKAAAAGADAGLTVADFALADTGTLVLFSAPGKNRSASLLPPVHVALVPASRILPELSSLIPRLPQDADAAESGSAVSLITGTSKTADIELTLVRGVHGPGEVHVILLTDAPPFEDAD